MRKLAMLAAASLAALATPALAQTVTSEVNGSPLPYQIFGIGTGPHDPANVVYGSSPSNDNGAPNVTFTSGAGSTVQVVISDGFAQIDPGTGTWTSLQIDPTEFDFTDFKFAISLEGATSDANDNVLVEYLLAGASDYVSWGTIDGLTAPNVNFELSGATFDAFRLSTVSAGVTFGTIKQMSYNPVGAPPPVPEPATWAMMLMGFGATGVAMRRSRRRKGLLTQFA